MRVGTQKSQETLEVPSDRKNEAFNSEKCKVFVQFVQVGNIS